MFTHKTLFYRGLTLCILAGACSLALVSGIPVALAQFAGPFAGVGAPPGANPIIYMMSHLAFINAFLQILIFIVLNFLQYLLQANFFNDPIMMGSLNSIWILSRNIMNIIFALMLIGVALYTIVTSKSELIKNKWGQFVVAVVLVNFSWFFPRVIIDAANVLTSTVYSVPDMLPGFACTKFDGTPCDVIVDTLLPANPPQAINTWKNLNGCNTPALAPTCNCNFAPAFCFQKIPYTKAKLTKGNAHAMVSGLATSFVKVQALGQIPRGIGGGAGGGGGAVAAFQTTFNLVLHIFMTALIQAILVLPLLGLVVGLFIRIIILWVTIAFMPFTFLGYVITGKLGTNLFGFEIDLWKEFINAAFLPAVVGIPFVIGFIMLSTVAVIPAPPGFRQAFGVPLLAGVNIWWELMWIFAAIGIIWIGAFTALRRSAITGKITDKIKGFGDVIFGIAHQLPLAVPFPVPIGGKQVNFGQVLGGPQKFLNQLRNANNGGAPVQPNKVPIPGANNPAVQANLVADSRNTANIVAAINKLHLNDKSGIKDLQNTIGGQALNEKQLLQALHAEINKGGFDANVKRQINQADLNKAIANAP